MKSFRQFKPGDKVRILADRVEDWQPADELTVARVDDNRGHGLRAAGHPQSLTMTNGARYSGWWFDPAAVCLWARDVSASHVSEVRQPEGDAK